MIFTRMKTPSTAAPILPFQPALDPALPVVLGNINYRNFEAQLRRNDQLLSLSDVETSFVGQSPTGYDQKSFPPPKPRTASASNSTVTAPVVARCSKGCWARIIAG
jgi:hypothetical protein